MRGAHSSSLAPVLKAVVKAETGAVTDRLLSSRGISSSSARLSILLFVLGPSGRQTHRRTEISCSAASPSVVAPPPPLAGYGWCATGIWNACIPVSGIGVEPANPLITGLPLSQSQKLRGQGSVVLLCSRTCVCAAAFLNMLIRA